MNKILTIKLYHGSPYKLEVLKPIGLDLGNRLQKPGWSIFMWKTREEALIWALMKKCQQLKNVFKEQGVSKFHAYWNYENDKVMMRCTDEKGFRKYCMDNQVITYIYTVRENIFNLGIGNDKTHDEYTIRGKEVKPINTEEIIINDEVIDNYITFVDDVKMARINNDVFTGKYNMHRGLLALLIDNGVHDNRIKYKEIITKIKKKEIKPGDDLANIL